MAPINEKTLEAFNRIAELLEELSDEQKQRVIKAIGIIFELNAG